MRLKCAILLLLAIPAAGQMPHPTAGPFSMVDVRKDFLLDFTRTVTVDKNYGTFHTIGAAISFVAALPDGSSGHACSLEAGGGIVSGVKVGQCRNWSNPWRIVVHRGNGSADPNTFAPDYIESAIVAPPYTTIEGAETLHNIPVSFQGGPVIQLTATSGTLITSNSGSGLSNLEIFWGGSQTGYIKAFEHIGPDYTGVVTNVSFQLAPTDAGLSVCKTDGTTGATGNNTSPCAIDGVVETAGGLYLYNTSVVSNRALGRLLVNLDAILGLSAYGGRWEGQSGCTVLMENSAAGSLALYEGARLGSGVSGCTCNLKNSSGMFLVSGGVTYASACGTGVITNGNLHAPYGTTNPSACSPGEQFTNTGSTKKHCDCVSANTWACVTIL